MKSTRRGFFGAIVAALIARKIPAVKPNSVDDGMKALRLLQMENSSAFDRGLLGVAPFIDDNGNVLFEYLDLPANRFKNCGLEPVG